MIIHQVAQGSEAWDQLRNGIPTASEFKRILTPKGRPSRQAEGYLNCLLAEWYFGQPLEDPETEFQSQWMARGQALEMQAVQSYEFERDVETEKVGFISIDSGLCGCSPDRLVGKDGILELKCPAPSTHIGYMLKRNVHDEYKPQLQGQLLIAERKWVDIQSYCPVFPTVIIRVERDDEYQGLLSTALATFVETMLTARQELAAIYGNPKWMEQAELASAK